jgi:hypothetical protein
MRLDKNDFSSNVRKTFELSENLAEKSNISFLLEKIAFEVECFFAKFDEKSRNF